MIFTLKMVYEWKKELRKNNTALTVLESGPLFCNPALDIGGMRYLWMRWNEIPADMRRSLTIGSFVSLDVDPRRFTARADYPQ